MRALPPVRARRVPHSRWCFEAQHPPKDWQIELVPVLIVPVPATRPCLKSGAIAQPPRRLRQALPTSERRLVEHCKVENQLCVIRPRSIHRVYVPRIEHAEGAGRLCLSPVPRARPMSNERAVMHANRGTRKRQTPHCSCTEGRSMKIEVAAGRLRTSDAATRWIESAAFAQGP